MTKPITQEQANKLKTFMSVVFNPSREGSEKEEWTLEKILEAIDSFVQSKDNGIDG